MWGHLLSLCLSAAAPTPTPAPAAFPLPAEVEAKLTSLWEAWRDPKKSAQLNFNAELKKRLNRSELVSLALAHDRIGSMSAVGLLLDDKQPLPAPDQDRLLAALEATHEFEGYQDQYARVVAKDAAGVTRLVEHSQPAQGRTDMARVMAICGIKAEASAATPAQREAGIASLLDLLGSETDAARMASNCIQPLNEQSKSGLIQRFSKGDASQPLIQHGMWLLANLEKGDHTKERQAIAYKYAEHPQAYGRIAGVSLLRTFGMKSEDQALYRKLLADAEPQVRSQLLSTMAEEHPKWSAPLLMLGLEDNLAESVDHAANGLTQLDYKPAMPKLMAKLKEQYDAKAPIRPMVGNAIIQLARLKGHSFAFGAECVQMEPGVHAMIAKDYSAEHRKEAERLLEWWESTGKKQKW